jgi:ribonuclease HII
MPSLDLEARLWRQGCRHVAGVDEAGRGCLAGPVVAAAVVLPEGLLISGVDDSKRLTARQRDALLPEIQARALGIGVGICSPEEVDRLNVLWAAMEAMRRAVAALPCPPDYLLIDGNHCFPGSPWPFETVVQGDARCHSIAAASIVAKTTRDRIMHDLHEAYPVYDWRSNVGYPTAAHYAALAEHGPSPYHRRSFRLS